MKTVKIILIFCFLAAIFSYAVLRIKGVSMDNLQTSIDTPDLFSKKIETPKTDIPIRLTEEDLNGLLKTYAAAETLTTKIGKDSVNIFGKVKYPLKTNISVSVKIFAEEGKIKGEITEMTLGGIKAIPMIRNSVEKGLNEALDSKVNDKIKVDRVEQDEDKIIIYGKLK